MEKLQHINHFAFRTPLLSRDWLLKLFRDYDKTIKELLDNKSFLHSVALASSSLSEGINKWKESNKEADYLAIRDSLALYIKRASSRCTPFAGFAGISAGQITQNATSLESQRKSQNYYELDSLLSFQTFEVLKKDKTFVKNSDLIVNGTVLEQEQSLRYIERQWTKSGIKYELSSVSSSALLPIIVEFCQQATSFEKVISFILEKLEAETSAVEDFIYKLVQENVLTVVDTLTVTGEPLALQIEALAKRASPQLQEQILKTMRVFKESDFEGDLQQAKQKLKSHIEQYLDNVSDENLLLVNQLHTYENLTINTNFIDKHQTSITKLVNYLKGDNEYFKEFRKKYQELYEGSFVPLLLVMDEEFGVPFGKDGFIRSELMQSLAFRGKESSNGLEMKFTNFEKLILEHIEHGIDQRKITISNSFIKKNTQQAFAGKEIDEVAVMSKLVEGGKMWLKTFASLPATKTISRFAHLSPELHNICQESANLVEQANDSVIYAELCFLPEGRYGNVSARPSFHEYEIPLLAGSTSAKQLKLNDLYLGVVNDELCLFSKSLGKQVIPRLSHSHNFFFKSLKLYKFLGFMQYLAGSPPSLDINNLARFYSYVPRVEFEKVILSPSTWFIDKAEIQGIDESLESFPDDVNRFINKYKLNERVLTGLNDNKIPFDLTNAESFKLLKRQVSRLNSQKIVLQEFIQSESSEFEHEIVLPLHKRAKNNALKTANQAGPIDLVENIGGQKQGIFEDCLSFKLFGGIKSLDTLLTSTLTHFLNALEQNNIIKRWFFIRYNVPDWHLRVRIFPNDRALTMKNLEVLFNNVTVKKLELADYVREYGRYGGEKMFEVVEEVFCKDSVEIIKSIEAHNVTPEYRWRLALKSVNEILNQVFGSEVELKQSFIKEVRDRMSIQYSNISAVRKQIGKFTRGVNLVEIMEQYHFDAGGYKNVARIWEQEVSSCTTWHSVLASIIHMHVNRVVLENGIQIEYAIYDMLFRLNLSSNQRRDK